MDIIDTDEGSPFDRLEARLARSALIADDLTTLSTRAIHSAADARALGRELWAVGVAIEAVRRALADAADDGLGNLIRFPGS